MKKPPRNKINYEAQQHIGNCIFIQELPHKYHGNTKHNTIRMGLFICRCGKQFEASIKSVKQFHTKSCGCVNVHMAMLKHGHGGRCNQSSEYMTWQSMLERCRNPKNRYYHNYGGRGISVCKRWIKFENFISDMGLKPKDQKYSIERINNDGNYEPSNCKWATREEQESNKRTNRYITYNGVTLHLSAWARKQSLKPNCIKNRLKNNWSIEKALTTPVKIKA